MSAYLYIQSSWLQHEGGKLIFRKYKQGSILDFEGLEVSITTTVLSPERAKTATAEV